MNVLTSGPRFQWDIKGAPWTDGRGEQLQYNKAVRPWGVLHDNQFDLNSAKNWDCSALEPLQMSERSAQDYRVRRARGG